MKFNVKRTEREERQKRSTAQAWFTILTPTSTSTIEMNPIPASTSASTSKDAADVEAVSLKFDAQLSVGVIL